MNVGLAGGSIASRALNECEPQQVGWREVVYGERTDENSRISANERRVRRCYGSNIF